MKPNPFLALALAALLFPYVSADITLIEPATQSVLPNQVVELGSVQPGERLELIVAPQTAQPLGVRWGSVQATNLPMGWVSNSAVSAENFVLTISIPKDAVESSYNFKVGASSSGDNALQETFTVSVFVRNDLLNSSISSLQESTVAGKQAVFTISLLNDSIAPHDVLIESDLPLQWYKPVHVTVAPHSVQKVSLVVTPQTYGQRNSYFSVKSALNDMEFKRFDAVLEVQPTLQSKFSVSLYGFPFFTPTLFPYYALNAFIALVYA